MPNNLLVIWKVFGEEGASISDLAVSSQAGRSPFVDLSNLIDYNASFGEVYSSFVRYTVLATRSLNILSLCHQRSRNRTKTWSVDLAVIIVCDLERSLRKDDMLLYQSLLANQRHKTFRASKDTRAFAKFHELSIVSAQGFRLGAIQKGIGIGMAESELTMSLLLSKLCSETFSDIILDKGVYGTNEISYKTLWNTWTGGVIEADEHALLFRKWLSWLDIDVEKIDDLEGWELRAKLESQAPDHEAWSKIAFPTPHRDLFHMVDGRIGKAWDSAKPDDVVCIILGFDVPLVLRQVDNHYELIGSCYIDGIMEGQAMKELEEGKVELETFDLH